MAEQTAERNMVHSHEAKDATIVGIEILNDQDLILVTLESGFRIGAPLHWFPWLQNATAEQRANYRIGAASIFFEDLQKGLDVDWMFWAALPPGERQALTTYW